jgi:pyruvate kinase
MRRTKILATVGPASNTPQALDALMAAGVNALRLNFSHGTHESHAATYARVREAAARAGREVAIVQDLSGPKIRTGRINGGRPLELTAGETLRIETGTRLGEPGIVSTEFDGLAAAVKAGDRLLLADGTIELRVEGTDGRTIQTTVVEGGPLGEHKGINAPGVPLAASAITDKDARDLAFGIELGVDLVALSFVQTAEDVRRARQIAVERGAADLPLVAKLERPMAFDHLEQILGVCDAVMIARGDLGLEMPLERVPRIQKQITVSARRRRVPVILATQVLESMTTGARPTRAEASDAANAVADGVDAIMLAGETAVGVSPARAVRTLDAIIRDAEASPAVIDNLSRVARAEETEHPHAQAICDAAVTLAEQGGAQAIVAITRFGGTARRLASLRPRVPIIAAADTPEMARRLSLLWGVVPFSADFSEDTAASWSHVVASLTAAGLLRPGVPVVLASVSYDQKRSDANFVKIHRA